jgi:hypothetical protein
MDELSTANKRIKLAHGNLLEDLDKEISALDEAENGLKERLHQLNQKKHEICQANGNLDSTDDDLVEVNAGGKIIVAKRSTLIQIQGTRLEALFSGRWDKKLSRDGHGRIFLDVDPTCFQAIVDYLSEMMISSEDSPPSPPSVDDEHEHILRYQLELFGLEPTVELPDSNIINNNGHWEILHDWLKEDGSDGEFSLLYRGTRDGLSGPAFHSKCDKKGCTLTIIETTDGKVFGGYSNTPWSSSDSWTAANKSFLFAISGSGISSPCKMKLKGVSDQCAILDSSLDGPIFGCGYDMFVQESKITLNPGNTYHPGSLPPGLYTIKEMEVFQLSGSSPSARIATSKGKTSQDTILGEPVIRFSNDINKAINAKHACLLHAKSEMLQLEESFKDEQTFIEKFASGDTKDVVALNVSGTIMVTMRSALRTAAEDSVLAQQFDDSKWTEQGCNAPRVNEWTPDEVSTWAKSIGGIPEEVNSMLYENEITGRELLALTRDDLKMMGMKRVGTVALLLKEIDKLEKASRDIVTLIEHSPYCFGKMLDYLRSKQLHSQGLLEKEPALPKVCDSQKNRFEKVVKYYFPGDAAKFILG